MSLSFFFSPHLHSNSFLSLSVTFYVTFILLSVSLSLTFHVSHFHSASHCQNVTFTVINFPCHSHTTYHSQNVTFIFPCHFQNMSLASLSNFIQLSEYVTFILTFTLHTPFKTYVTFTVSHFLSHVTLIFPSDVTSPFSVTFTTRHFQNISLSSLFCHFHSLSIST